MPVVTGKTAGEECCKCPFLGVINIVGEFQGKFKEVELSCLVDTGSQVTKIAKSGYDACLPSIV